MCFCELVRSVCWRGFRGLEDCWRGVGRLVVILTLIALKQKCHEYKTARHHVGGDTPKNGYHHGCEQ